MNLRFLSLRVLPSTSSNRIRQEEGFIVTYVELATLREAFIHLFIDQEFFIKYLPCECPSVNLKAYPVLWSQPRTVFTCSQCIRLSFLFLS